VGPALSCAWMDQKLPNRIIKPMSPSVDETKPTQAPSMDGLRAGAAISKAFAVGAGMMGPLDAPGWMEPTGRDPDIGSACHKRATFRTCFIPNAIDSS